MIKIDGLFSVCLLVSIFYFARDIFVPLALATLLAFLLEPLARRLELFHLGRTASALLAMLTVLMALCLLAFIVSKELAQVAANLPAYESKIHQRVQQIRDGYSGPAGRIVKSLQDFRNELAPTNSSTPAFLSGNSTNAVAQKPVPVKIQNSEQSVLEIVQKIFTPSLRFLVTFLLVVIFCIFILLGRDDLRKRLVRISGPHNVKLTTHFLVETDKRLSRYLLMQLLVNVCYGLVAGLGLWLIGIPNPLVWGIFVAIFRYIPYAGPWIGAALPFAIAFAVDPGWSKAVMVLVLFAVLEIVTANFAEPWLYGRYTGITSLGVLLAAVFWTWLWGPVGLLLSMPLTVTIASIARYFPQFKVIDHLFGESYPVDKKPSVNQTISMQ